LFPLVSNPANDTKNGAKTKEKTSFKVGLVTSSSAESRFFPNFAQGFDVSKLNQIQ